MIFDLQENGKYFIETFGKNYLGEVKEVTTTRVVLVKCSWVADTGRFGEFMRKGNPADNEPYPDEFEVQVPLAYIANVTLWPHKLVRETI